ncbi:hypothetical protein EV697_101114 [Bisgaardia hudsonensis]|uniref:Probable membrane transporter protein n=1 Tax=Bisgaardia hudsonensis TaxID=109472 RepID=A0A4R2N2B4_9PAST|nr:sulfite exporter TauE/SafE family protein [Bisgaardia hudsonensis]QLB12456.1 hypothetical protein A6A11_01965 [Bisgaardia hudsonensis]TCP13993.1 hypothetical protein EV697_101114 [Bisgaardia hudsonensis]
MSITVIIILIICGTLTNLMSALFGIGGGVLMVPVLHTLFPEFPLQMVAATSLTIVIGTSIINLFYFYKQKIQINFKSMLLWSIGMIIGVQIGFEGSFYIPDWSIIAIFVITLSILGIRTLFLNNTLNNNENKQNNDTLKGIIFCFLGGSIAGVTGIGGGSIMAPLVAQLTSVKPYQIAAYTNYMMVIGGLGSLYGYLTKIPDFYLVNSWQIGYINFSVVVIVVISSFLTSFLSMKIRGILSPEISRKLLGIILFIIAGYMLALQIN